MTALSRASEPARCPTRTQCLRFFRRMLSGLSIHAMHWLVVHRFSRAPQQHLQPPIPKRGFSRANSTSIVSPTRSARMGYPGHVQSMLLSQESQETKEPS